MKHEVKEQWRFWEIYIYILSRSYDVDKREKLVYTIYSIYYSVDYWTLGYLRLVSPTVLSNPLDYEFVNSYRNIMVDVVGCMHMSRTHITHTCTHKTTHLLVRIPHTYTHIWAYKHFAEFT